MTKRKIIFLTIVVMLIVNLIINLSYIYFSGCFEPPYCEGKLVIDIWNNSNETVSGMTLSYDKSDETRLVPDILPHERVIVLCEQSNRDLPKLVMKVTYNSITRDVFGEVFANTNTDAIIKIDSKNRLHVKDLSYTFWPFKQRIYYKPYHRLVDLT